MARRATRGLGFIDEAHRETAARIARDARGSIVRAGKHARTGGCLHAFHAIVHAEEAMGFMSAHLLAVLGQRDKAGERRFNRLRAGLASARSKFVRKCVR